MIVQVIGSGGAFDKINSSFFVQGPSENILFDCGSNIFEHVKYIAEHIDMVYISHLDDDHVGSLKTLVYYRYFAFGKKTKIVFHKNVNLEEFMNIQGKFNIINGKELDIVEFNPIEGPTKIKSIEIIPIQAKHHINCYGAIFNQKVFISGDTVAIKEIEEQVREHMGVSSSKLYFHDLNYHNQNNHATEDNIKETYSKEFSSQLKYYHNDRNELEGKVFRTGENL